MARLSSQKQKLIATIDSARTVFAQLTATSTGRAKEQLEGLYGQWIRDNLSASRKSIEAVDVKKVRELRRYRQPTHAVFESHIEKATSALEDEHGVIYSISELFKDTGDFSAHEINRLGRVLQLTKSARRQGKIFRSTSLSLVTSGQFWVLMAVAAILTIPAYRYGSVYWRRSDASAPPIGTALSAQVGADIQSVRSQAAAPDKPLIERSASTVKAAWDLIDTVPKIINALVAAWGIFLVWLRR